MAVGKEDEGDQNQIQAKGMKGKSCKGCLYYSSILKSKSRNPRCVGVSRTLQQVPGYIVGESEMEASKEGRGLTDFKYACVGYSVYLEGKDASTDSKEKQAELPFCVGIELLVDKRPSTADHAPVHTHNREVIEVLYWRQTAQLPKWSSLPAKSVMIAVAESRSQPDRLGGPKFKVQTICKPTKKRG